MMLKVAVCDDSDSELEQLEGHLESMQRVEVEYEVFQSAGELLQFMDENKVEFDVYLLDIEMPEMNGITLANTIHHRDISAVVLFQTNHLNYVWDAFDVGAFHYLQKPIAFEKLEEVLIRIEKLVQKQNQRFHFTYAKNSYSIACNDIVYFEQRGRKVVIYTKEQKYQTYTSIKEIVKRLDVRRFVMLSISYVANLQYVKCVSSDVAELSNGISLPISKKNKKAVREKQLQYEMMRI